jgi:hypothetical protein
MGQFVCHSYPRFPDLSGARRITLSVDNRIFAMQHVFLGIMDGCFVAYYRVSTEKQDQECAAQRMAVEQYLNGGGWKLLGEFVEVETGKINDHPQLEEALAFCRKRKGTLVIAKLDRLSRDLAFIANLMESKVKFVACDMPNASRFELHIRASLAEEERRFISKRTSDALQAKKVQGTPWVSRRSGRLVEPPWIAGPHQGRGCRPPGAAKQGERVCGQDATDH